MRTGFCCAGQRETSNRAQRARGDVDAAHEASLSCDGVYGHQWGQLMALDSYSLSGLNEKQPVRSLSLSEDQVGFLKRQQTPVSEARNAAGYGRWLWRGSESVPQGYRCIVGVEIAWGGRSHERPFSILIIIPGSLEGHILMNANFYSR